MADGQSRARLSKQAGAVHIRQIGGAGDALLLLANSTGTGTGTKPASLSAFAGKVAWCTILN